MGSITGLFTVLVEGDDTNEPVTGAVRGILDRHIVLDQGIAGGGRFSAVDIPRSLSRSAAACHLPEERSLAREARRLMRAYAEMADLVRLDAYKGGSNPELDAAIAARPALEALLRQELDETARPGAGSWSSSASWRGWVRPRIGGGMSRACPGPPRARLKRNEFDRERQALASTAATVAETATAVAGLDARFATELALVLEMPAGTGLAARLCCGPPRAAEAPPGRRPAPGGASTAAGAGSPGVSDQAQDA